MMLTNMIEIPLSRLMCTGAFTIIKAPISGKTYVCPAWIEVPDGTAMSDIKVIHDKSNNVAPVIKRNEYAIKGSTGKTYSVVIDPKGNSCSCTGFTFYRKCKHIEQVLTKHKLK
jgi:hypothetical protein